METDLENANRENGQLRQAALRLVRCMGSQAALSCCQNNQWHGLYNEILSLDARAVEARH